ncbi:DNA polymerase subunit beta [Limnohabitans sp. 2KL-1]|uniref:type VII toxin-antitoxin system MntA family adenylyltransferase antitoxin n=1 Tax=Limnohabitans sp. 2KL-1 TaxID=1100699 RepID=UPI000D3DA608|nr:nucleotidyltransferase domain-containing protein [Limnohabitans sp. 2KL-1]PUE50488.1 DNA polymerase subunit beta [Limnohabitans sp. 2KL-1]
MHKDALITLLQQRLPGLLAVYAFGSRIQNQGQSARSDSDLDLAVLLEGYGDPVTLFGLSGPLADIAGCPVDLLDIRAASTVMQYQILTLGTAWWRKDVRAGLFEAAMLSEKMALNEARSGLIGDVTQRGSVYGR